MKTSAPNVVEVLIAGAGPTGLVLAIWLTRLGIRVRIVDKLAAPETTSRAIGVQARTLEFYRQLGISDEIIARGHKAAAMNLWISGRHRARFPFAEMGADISPFPFALVISQDEHEKILTEHLSGLGVEIERAVELLDFVETENGISVRLKKYGGAVEICEALYLAGCDGAHSTVREKLKIGFSGGTYARKFYVADVHADGPAMNGEINVALDAADFLVIFPLGDSGRARLVGALDESAENSAANQTWRDVNQSVIETLRLKILRVNWFSTYRVHHRVADSYRCGRTFLLGDAAHVHSPVGGQGLNTGVGDAVNLAWKLAAVLRRHASAALLETYHPERTAFARRLVNTTDRVFAGVTSPRFFNRQMRLKLVPFLLPKLFQIGAVRQFMFLSISQCVVNYRGHNLGSGCAGKIRGGDRLPWLKPQANQNEDNFSPLNSLDWQVHVCGETTQEIQKICAERSLSLHIFPWREEMRPAGFLRDAVYLVRPDGHVALASPAAGAKRVFSFLENAGVKSACHTEK
jgi:2-polyprenyl-6-methoxyphenol hydroxylase-like FAD-dependent oxidoreductase